MAIDSQRVGAMAMEFMESLELRFGDDAQLETLGFIAAIADVGGATSITWQFAHADGSGVPLYVGRGMLAETDRGLTSAEAG